MAFSEDDDVLSIALLKFRLTCNYRQIDLMLSLWDIGVVGIHLSDRVSLRVMPFLTKSWMHAILTFVFKFFASVIAKKFPP